MFGLPWCPWARWARRPQSRQRPFATGAKRALKQSATKIYPQPSPQDTYEIIGFGGGYGYRSLCMHRDLYPYPPPNPMIS